jgi:pSer/pThr/pTyr-binding forkhead associated (FHA) protein
MVPEHLLGLLKLCLLALIYLFFVRVLWAVWSEVRAVRPRTEPSQRAAAMPETAAATVAAKGGRARRGAPGVPQRLVIDQPPTRRGARFDLDVPELTIGRATGCHVPLPDDTFASTLHARVFERDGSVYVEDLGSTNGTYVNGMRLAAPVVLRPGDHLQVGSTVMEAS